MFNNILIIIYLLMLIGVVFFERKHPSEAVMWVLILIFLPYLGAVLYIIFGSTMNIKLTAFFRNFRLQDAYRKNALLHGKYTAKNINTPPEDASETQKSFINFNQNYNESPLTSYETAQLFTTGKTHYDKLFADISNAKHAIHVQFYTIHNDLAGKALVELLTKKALEGLEVWVMIDFIANVSSPPSMFKPLKDAGGTLKRLKPYLTHFRSHRKLVLIDHEIAYIGGMNIGEKYLGRHKYKKPWRDTQIRLTGECLTLLEYYFLTDWICTLPRRELKKLPQMVNHLLELKNYDKGKPCQFVIGGVDNEKQAIKMNYLSMIRSAKKHILIQSPYFIPDSSVLDALKTAAAAGVQIELMTPGISSGFALEPCSNFNLGQLLEFGAKVYKYRGYIHAKTIVIDEELCCIGSVNMDVRSLEVDDEICGIFYDSDLIAECEQIFNADMKNCRSYTKQEFQNRGLRQKITEKLYLFFTPLM